MLNSRLGSLCLLFSLEIGILANIEAYKSSSTKVVKLSIVLRIWSVQ